VVQHPSGNILVVVGAKGCRGGPIFVDVTDPLTPKEIGSYCDDGYTHDAQIVVYRGPDTRYLGKTIMTAYNEDTLTILDISGKSIGLDRLFHLSSPSCLNFWHSSPHPFRHHKCTADLENHISRSLLHPSRMVYR